MPTTDVCSCRVAKGSWKFDSPVYLCLGNFNKVYDLVFEVFCGGISAGVWGKKSHLLFRLCVTKENLIQRMSNFSCVFLENVCFIQYKSRRETNVLSSFDILP